MPSGSRLYDYRQVDDDWSCDMPLIRILDMTPQNVLHVDRLLVREVVRSGRNCGYRQQDDEEQLLDVFHI